MAAGPFHWLQRLLSGPGPQSRHTRRLTGTEHCSFRMGRQESRGGTYSAHEVQERGSDGWVGLHGVVHDQDGRLWRG